MLYLVHQVGAVAQLVEQRTENPRVVSSTLTGATKKNLDPIEVFSFLQNPALRAGNLLQKLLKAAGGFSTVDPVDFVPVFD